RKTRNMDQKTEETSSRRNSGSKRTVSNAYEKPKSDLTLKNSSSKKSKPRRFVSESKKKQKWDGRNEAGSPHLRRRWSFRTTRRPTRPIQKVKHSKPAMGGNRATTAKRWWTVPTRSSLLKTSLPTQTTFSNLNRCWKSARKPPINARTR